MHSAPEGILYADLNLQADTEYFLYIGEIKANCLNQFLQETLSNTYHNNFACISIVPDVFSSYSAQNILVINPRSQDLFAAQGCAVNCRLSVREFAAQVSASSTVQELVQELLQRQDRLFIHVYESVPELTLTDIPGVQLLGPHGHTAHLWNNKLHQLQTLYSSTVPVIDFRTCASYQELLYTADQLWKTWDQGLFISQPYSAAGLNSFIAYSPRDLHDKIFSSDSSYLISKYIPHSADPTVLGITAGAHQVFIAAVADQEIAEGNRFKGSVFPSELPGDIQLALQEYTRTIGRILGQSGYRGIFGCDYVLDHQDKIHFVEVNARKQGTTMEMCCALENLLPQGAPSLMDLEFQAVTKDKLPANARELRPAPVNLFWRTYNFKTEHWVQIEDTIHQEYDERELFKHVAGNRLQHRALILEHPGRGLLAEPGTFVGRIAAVSNTRQQLDQDIQQGKLLIEKSIAAREYAP